MSRRIRLVLDLEGDGSESIAGSVRKEGGAERSFTGWLELMALVREELGHEQSSGTSGAVGHAAETASTPAGDLLRGGPDE